MAFPPNWVISHRRRGARTARCGALLAAGLLATCLIGQTPRSVAATNTADELPVDAGGVPQRVRLITREQYLNSLHYIFGPDLHLDARFPPMQRIDGLLANGAATAGVTDQQMEQYQHTASFVANTVVGPAYRDYVLPCKPANAETSDTACATLFLGTIGRLVYRKPLSQEKLTHLVQEASANADKSKDFYAGLSVALEGMLLSPDVLLITDHYEKDPAIEGKYRLDSYSLAQRLSFFLWNAAPDELLIKAAETGEIQTPKGRERVVNRMMASPRLQVGMRAFFDDMMSFDDFGNLAKDGTIYPSFTAAAVVDAREQTLRTIIRFLFTEDHDYRDLYTTRETVMSPALGPIYGVTTRPGWNPYTFPERSGRAGILTQASFLALHSHPGRSSPTLRGKAIREVLLCERVPRPPPNVDFSLIENPPPNIKTQRQRLEIHRQNPVCAGCHKITDPLGLTLEQFDGAGVYRTTEHGAPIDPSGSLDGKGFDDAAGLAQALREEPALTSCLTRRIYSYGTGGPLSARDQPTLKYLDRRFAEDGYRVPALIRTITLSPVFSEIVPPAAPAQKTASAQQTPAANAN